MPVHKKQIQTLARLHGYWLFKSFLSKTAHWPIQRKRAYIFEKLKRTLTQAYDGVPFYRERFRNVGFNPHKDFHHVEDLAALPLLTKEDVRAHGDEMIDRRYLFNSVIAHTSGTSGTPTKLRLNESYIAFDYACMFRHWSLAGYRFRAPLAALRSYVPDTSNGPLWKYNWLENSLYMSAYHLKPSNCEQYIDALIRFQPHYIRAYPSSINVLAEYAWPWRDKLRFVRGIFTASETLLPSERSTIERTFGAVVYDWYGMTEPAVVITERADHQGMEINWEYGFPELLASNELGSNERHLVATSLHNPVMPFIRYQTEDIVNLNEPTPDTKHTVYPIIHSITGRKDECFITPDGRRLPSLNFYSLLQSHTEILQFQFIQTALDKVEMKLSLRPGVKAVDDLLTKLQTEIAKRLGHNVSLNLTITDSFETSRDGKATTFLRKFRPYAEPALSFGNKTFPAASR
jgi:phenylacetate-CoA ligase